MVVIFILIGLSLIVALIFLFLFIWSVKNGQYDDDYTPSVRILFDDEKVNDSNLTEKDQKSFEQDINKQNK